MSMNTPPQAPRAPQGSQAKSRMVAAILTFFLGQIGVGDFYLGYIRQAITKIGLTVVAYGSAWWSSALAVKALETGSGSWAIGVLIALSVIAFIALGILILIAFIQILTRKGRYATDAQGVPLV